MIVPVTWNAETPPPPGYMVRVVAWTKRRKLNLSIRPWLTFCLSCAISRSCSASNHWLELWPFRLLRGLDATEPFVSVPARETDGGKCGNKWFWIGLLASESIYVVSPAWEVGGKQLALTYLMMYISFSQASPFSPPETPVHILPQAATYI